MRPLAVLLAVALVACAPETAAPPSVAPSAATPSAAVPISVGRSAACASVAALSTSNASPTPAPRDRPMPTPAPPGRYLFAKDSTTLQLYASGRLSAIVLDLEWRHPDELTFLAGPSRSYPVRGATLWSWRGGSQPVRLGTLDVASPSIAWREDGAMLAYVGVAADGSEAIHVREVTTQNEISDRIIFTVDDVVGAKAGCGLRRDELRFGLLSWQA